MFAVLIGRYYYCCCCIVVIVVFSGEEVEYVYVSVGRMMLAALVVLTPARASRAWTAGSQTGLDGNLTYIFIYYICCLIVCCCVHFHILLVCLFACLLACLFVYLFNCLFVCVCVCVCVCLLLFD